MLPPHELAASLANSVLNRLGGSNLQLSNIIKYPKIDALYEKAKTFQWNATEKLSGLGASKDQEPDNLGFSITERQALARLLSQYYYGERGAQIISSQLVSLVQDNEAAKFLSSQVMDEARHVETFEKLLSHLDCIHPINPFLNTLLTDMQHTAHFEEKLIGMNLLVEGLALTTFNYSVRMLRDHPNLTKEGRKILMEPLQLIIRDESRHVGFGTQYPQAVMRDLSIRRKLEIQTRQLIWMGLLYGSVKYHQADAAVFGIDYVEIVQDILVDHQERVNEIGQHLVIDTRLLQSLLPYVDMAVSSAASGYWAVEKPVEGLVEMLKSAATRLVAFH